MAEHRQKWQKNEFEMSIINHFLPSFLFLSCQAPISVLPNSPFCTAKLIHLSKGAKAPRPPSGTPMMLSVVRKLNTKSQINSHREKVDEDSEQREASKWGRWWGKWWSYFSSKSDIGLCTQKMKKLQHIFVNALKIGNFQNSIRFLKGGPFFKKVIFWDCWPACRHTGDEVSHS